MNSKISVLAVILVLQMLIIAWVWLIPSGQDHTEQQLLQFQVEEITGLAIADGSDQVRVEKQGDTWQVGRVPADSVQLVNILNKLANLEARWPVATSSASAERFEVGEQNFQRRVRLYSGETLMADLYLGTSPSYQRVHARRADDNNVYSVALSNFELATAADNWIDKGVFALDEAPQQIELVFTEKDRQPVQLTQTPEGWLYNNAAADADAAQTYANRFTTLQVLGLSAQAESREVLATIKLTQGDKIRTFVIAQVADEEDEYRIAEQRKQSSDETQYRVATYIAEQLLMTDADFSAKEDDTPTEEDRSDVGEG